MTTYAAGAVARSTVTFVPTTGTVELADVRVRAITAEGDVITNLTPEAGADPNVFYADINIPDDAISGPWGIRWWSSDPDIVAQDDTFQVERSVVPTG